MDAQETDGGRFISGCSELSQDYVANADSIKMDCASFQEIPTSF